MHSHAALGGGAVPRAQSVHIAICGSYLLSSGWRQYHPGLRPECPAARVEPRGRGLGVEQQGQGAAEPVSGRHSLKQRLCDRARSESPHRHRRSADFLVYFSSTAGAPGGNSKVHRLLAPLPPAAQQPPLARQWVAGRRLLRRTACIFFRYAVVSGVLSLPCNGPASSHCNPWPRRADHLVCCAQYSVATWLSQRRADMARREICLIC